MCLITLQAARATVLLCSARLPLPWPLIRIWTLRDGIQELAVPLESVENSTGYIISVDDAYQNIAKNTDVMVRGNFPHFDSFLRWASQRNRTKAQPKAAFDLACDHIAGTARPVKALPEIDAPKLTFPAMMSLFARMLQTPSAGAHEQYICAALLDARIQQNNTEGQRVETKTYQPQISAVAQLATFRSRVVVMYLRHLR